MSTDDRERCGSPRQRDKRRGRALVRAAVRRRGRSLPAGLPVERPVRRSARTNWAQQSLRSWAVRNAERPLSPMRRARLGSEARCKSAATRPSASPGVTVMPQPASRIVSAVSQCSGPTKMAGRPAAITP